MKHADNNAGAPHGLIRQCALCNSLDRDTVSARRCVRTRAACRHQSNVSRQWCLQAAATTRVYNMDDDLHKLPRLRGVRAGGRHAATAAVRGTQLSITTAAVQRGYDSQTVSREMLPCSSGSDLRPGKALLYGGRTRARALPRPAGNSSPTSWWRAGGRVARRWWRVGFQALSQASYHLWRARNPPLFSEPAPSTHT